MPYIPQGLHAWPLVVAYSQATTYSPLPGSIYPGGGLVPILPMGPPHHGYSSQLSADQTFSMGGLALGLVGLLQMALGGVGVRLSMGGGC